MKARSEPWRRARELPPRPNRDDEDEPDPLGEWTLDEVDSDFDFVAARATRDADAAYAD